MGYSHVFVDDLDATVTQLKHFHTFSSDGVEVFRWRDLECETLEGDSVVIVDRSGFFEAEDAFQVG